MSYFFLFRRYIWIDKWFSTVFHSQSFFHTPKNEKIKVKKFLSKWINQWKSFPFYYKMLELLCEVWQSKFLWKALNWLICIIEIFGKLFVFLNIKKFWRNFRFIFAQDVILNRNSLKDSTENTVLIELKPEAVKTFNHSTSKNLHLWSQNFPGN